MADDVSSLSCHPFRPLLAVACYNGVLQVWDYEMKLLMNLREFNFKAIERVSNRQRSIDVLRSVPLHIYKCLSFF